MLKQFPQWYRIQKIDSFVITNTLWICVYSFTATKKGAGGACVYALPIINRGLFDELPPLRAIIALRR